MCSTSATHANNTSLFVKICTVATLIFKTTVPELPFVCGNESMIAPDYSSYCHMLSFKHRCPQPIRANACMHNGFIKYCIPSTIPTKFG